MTRPPRQARKPVQPVCVLSKDNIERQLTLVNSYRRYAEEALQSGSQSEMLIRMACLCDWYSVAAALALVRRWGEQSTTWCLQFLQYCTDTVDPLTADTRCRVLTSAYDRQYVDPQTFAAVHADVDRVLAAGTTPVYAASMLRHLTALRSVLCSAATDHGFHTDRPTLYAVNLATTLTYEVWTWIVAAEETLRRAIAHRSVVTPHTRQVDACAWYWLVDFMRTWSHPVLLTNSILSYRIPPPDAQNTCTAHVQWLEAYLHRLREIRLFAGSICTYTRTDLSPTWQTFLRSRGSAQAKYKSTVSRRWDVEANAIYLNMLELDHISTRLWRPPAAPVDTATRATPATRALAVPRRKERR